MKKFESAYQKGLITLAEWRMVQAIYHIATNDGELLSNHDEIVEVFVRESQFYRTELKPSETSSI